MAALLDERQASLGFEHQSFLQVGPVKLAQSLPDRQIRNALRFCLVHVGELASTRVAPRAANNNNKQKKKTCR